MHRSRRLFAILFWLSTCSLIAFCLLFGLPFASRFAAGKVLAMAGCSPPTFDRQGICPGGSYAEPFVPLSHWMTSAAAPYILVINFGALLAAWTIVCTALFAAWQIFRARSRSLADQNAN